jgi:precorrin-6B methylase 2
MIAAAPAQSADPLASTPFEVVDWALSLAEIAEDDLFVDLGCGDGRALIFASADYGCRSIGVDIDRRAVAVAKRNIERNGVDKLATVVQGDVRTVVWHDATVVYCYLPAELLAEITPKLSKLKPGSRVVSYMHPIDLPNEKRHERSIGGSKHVVYVYQIPKQQRGLR